MIDWDLHRNNIIIYLVFKSHSTPRLMKILSAFLLLLCIPATSLFGQETDQYDIPPELKGDNPLVVTPANGIRPAEYTELDLNKPQFKFEKIANPPYGSLRVRPQNNFAEGYSGLRWILANVYEVPTYRIQGPEYVFEEKYELAFVHTGNESGFYDVLREKIESAIPYQLKYRRTEVEKYELRDAGSGRQKMKRSDGSKRQYKGTAFQISGTGIDVDQFADFISRQNGVDVINKTGVEGFFDINFSSEQMRNPEKLSTDLEEKLGLTLVPVKEMDWVVILE